MREGIVVVEVYRGKYDTDERLESALGAVSIAVPRALERVKARLGIAIEEMPAMAVCVADGLEIDSDNGVAEAGAELVRCGTRQVGVVLLAAEDVIAGTMDIEATLVHEITHVLHKAYSADVRVPLWVAEGLARWVEMQDKDEREALVLAYVIHRPGEVTLPISRLLCDEDELRNADARAQDVAGAVVFFGLEAVIGPERMRHVAVRILRARDWRSAMEVECEAGIGDVLRLAAESYGEWTATMKPGTMALRKANELCEAGRSQEAATLNAPIVAGEYGEALRAWGEMLQWKIQWRAGDLPGALGAIRKFRHERAAHPLIIDSWSDEIEMLSEQGAWEGVREASTSALRDVMWMPSMSTRRRRATELRARALEELRLQRDRQRH